MKINELKWETSQVFKDGPRKWDSSTCGYSVAVVSSYRSYTSADFVFGVVEELCRLLNVEKVSAAFSQMEDYEYFDGELITMPRAKSRFEEAGWGVWLIRPGNLAPRSDDLIDMLHSIEPTMFCVYVDIDGGMFVVCPTSRLRDSLEQHCHS